MVVLFLLLLCVSFTEVCKGTVSGVDFDITPLMNNEEDYYTSIQTPDSTTNMTLVYNFCRNTVNVPQFSEGNTKCVETQHKIVNGKAEMTKEPSPVYLLSKKGEEEDSCARLALDFSEESNSEWALYDVTDPAMGVVLKYKNGDFCCPYASCTSDSDYRQRSFTISLRCADATNTIPTSTTIETINNGCDTSVFYRSIYSCPTTCPHSKENVCGLHGVCGYDPVTSAARCYCTTNYYGDDCSKFSNKQLISLNGLVIALTVVVTGVVISTLFAFWNRLRKFNVNPDAFEALENKFNELGQMAT